MEGADMCGILNDSFHTVFTIEPSGEMPNFADRTHTKFDPNPEELYDVATGHRERLKALSPDKSPGPDGVHPRVLKECADELAAPESGEKNSKKLKNFNTSKTPYIVVF
jgi:hypothetical protein